MLRRRRARGRATITFDPNCRPTVMGDARVVRRRTEDPGWPATSSRPARTTCRLYSGRPHEAAGATVAGPRARLVVITHGWRGSSAATRRHAVAVSAEPVEVVDTVGAGDSFMAGLLAGSTTPVCWVRRPGPAGAARRRHAAPGCGSPPGSRRSPAGRRGADSPTAPSWRPPPMSSRPHAPEEQGVVRRRALLENRRGDSS